MTAIKGPLGIIVIIIFLLIFLHLIFNPTLSVTYLYMVVGVIGAVLLDKYVLKTTTMFPIEREGTMESRVVAVLWAGAIYGIMSLGLGWLTQNYLSTSQSVIQLLSTNMPLLQDNLILSILSYGIMIPFLETYLINVIGLELGLQFADSAVGNTIPKRDFWANFTNWRIWMVVLLFAGIFIMYHIQIRGLDPSATVPLVITGIFSIISSWMVIGFREGIQAILLHNMTNIIATLALVKTLS